MITKSIPSSRRTTEEILAALLAGHLDVADVTVRETVIVEKIDCSGDEKKVIEKRTFIEGVCIEIEKF